VKGNCTCCGDNKKKFTGKDKADRRVGECKVKRDFGSFDPGRGTPLRRMAKEAGKGSYLICLQEWGMKRKNKGGVEMWVG